MKLYFSPGACSLASHIALCEAGFDCSLEKVDLRAKTTADGGDFRAINPKGYVPALVLDDGATLTEGVAILQHLADIKPEAKLAPAGGTLGRARVNEWLTFISSEVHKGFGPLWNPKLSDDLKAAAKKTLGDRLAFIDAALAGKAYLTGEAFTVPDAYLFTVARWAAHFDIDLAAWPNLAAFMDRMRARPAVKRALEEEGIA